ncbi:hypothetical protein K438DRAFT_965465 [Mycena galopus ATCC 62051]|nr:hypothetical protein K438DRAFT_965465 [Mycena galopus ATCC 62051]
MMAAALVVPQLSVSSSEVVCTLEPPLCHHLRLSPLSSSSTRTSGPRLYPLVLKMRTYLAAEVLFEWIIDFVSPCVRSISEVLQTRFFHCLHATPENVNLPVNFSGPWCLRISEESSFNSSLTAHSTLCMHCPSNMAATC